MTETSLSPNDLSPSRSRLALVLWPLAIVGALLGILAVGFLIGKGLAATDPDVIELRPRPANGLDRQPIAPITLPQTAPASGATLDPASLAAIGRPAPDFTLQTSDGRTVRLSDLKGKTVLLNFWATWCAPCLIEMPHLEQIYQKYKGQDFVILAVNQAESAERVKQYMYTYDLTFPAVLDTDTAVARQYRVTGYPTSWLIDRDGNLRELRRGAFGNTTQIEQLIAPALAMR